MAHLRLRLLGSPQVDLDGRPVRLSEHALLLLAMVATRPNRTAPRDELAFALWPDHTESDARAALRRHLYKLRAALGADAEPWFRCTATTVAWAGDARTWVDVNELRRLRANAATAPLAATFCTAAFLPAVDHEWAAKVRDAVRAEACATLEALLADASRRGDARGAVRYAELLLVHDPWREDTLRTLLALLAQRGDRAGALMTYRRFAARLADEIGVDPMPETAALYATIARGERAAPAHFAYG